MVRRSKPQYASVEQPFGAHQAIIHCPLCGKPTVQVSEGLADVTPCPHLAFIYSGEAGEFVYESPDFAARNAAFEPDEEEDFFLDFDNFPEFLERLGYGANLLALEHTYGGMGCGPMWFTDVYGFDFAASTGRGEKTPARD
ncbi:MAG: hypothetical protein Kow00109_23540 [Acidobacteriota bacterium]